MDACLGPVAFRGDTAAAVVGETTALLLETWSDGEVVGSPESGKVVGSGEGSSGREGVSPTPEGRDEGVAVNDGVAFLAPAAGVLLAVALPSWEGLAKRVVMAGPVRVGVCAIEGVPRGGVALPLPLPPPLLTLGTTVFVGRVDREDSVGLGVVVEEKVGKADGVEPPLL